MTGQLLRLAPTALQTMHWHPDANEMHYSLRGRIRVTMFTADKHLASAEIGPGDCAYIPSGCAHMIENTGGEVAEFIAVSDRPRLRSVSMTDWVEHAPLHLLVNNLRIDAANPPDFRGGHAITEGAG